MEKYSSDARITYISSSISECEFFFRPWEKIALVFSFLSPIIFHTSIPSMVIFSDSLDFSLPDTFCMCMCFLLEQKVSTCFYFSRLLIGSTANCLLVSHFVYRSYIWLSLLTKLPSRIYKPIKKRNLLTSARKIWILVSDFSAVRLFNKSFESILFTFTHFMVLLYSSYLDIIPCNR